MFMRKMFLSNSACNLYPKGKRKEKIRSFHAVFDAIFAIFTQIPRYDTIAYDYLHIMHLIAFSI